MQSKLASKDLELAKTQQNLALLQSEVVELRRFSKRDGINMDYLKNIVIQVGGFICADMIGARIFICQICTASFDLYMNPLFQ